MAHRYNSPPNWPAPPPGWTPPEGWQPDASWGPAPEGWEFWTTVRPNTGAWGWAYFSALTYYVLLIATLVIATGTFNPEEAGRLLVPFLLGGTAVGFFARRSKGWWPLWSYPLAVFGASLAFAVLSGASRAGAS